MKSMLKKLFIVVISGMAFPLGIYQLITNPGTLTGSEYGYFGLVTVVILTIAAILLFIFTLLSWKNRDSASNN